MILQRCLVPIGSFLLIYGPTATEANAQSAAAADTATLTTARTDFSRYRSPAFCAAAAHAVRDAIQRGADFRVYVALHFGAVPPGDSSAARAATVARACGARFTIANTPPSQLLDLLDLATVAQNDSLARAVAQRLFTAGLGLDHASGKAEQLAVNDSGLEAVVPPAIYAALSTLPRRTSILETLAEQIAASSYSNRHYWGMVIWSAVLWDAAQSFDRRRMRDAAGQILALVKSAVHEPLFFAPPNIAPPNIPVPPEALQTLLTPFVPANGDQMIQYAYDELAAIAAIDAPDSIAALGAAEAALVNALPNAPRFPGPRHPVEASGMADQLSMRIRNLALADVGKPATVPHPDRWYPAPPETGHVTIIVSELIDPSNPMDLSAGTCFAPTNTLYAASFNCLVWPHLWIADWLHAYGAAGLHIVVLDQTWGTFLETPLPASEEADTLRWFWQDYLKLPITLGLVERTFKAPLPAPDGRVSPNLYTEPSLLPYMGTPVTLVGSHGELLYQGAVTPFFQTLLAHVMHGSAAVARAPRETASKSATSSPATPASLPTPSVPAS